MSSNKAVMSPGGNIMSKLSDGGKDKPKRRSIVERELETNMTAKVTSPAGTSRTTNNPFRRSLNSKQENEYPQNEKSVTDTSTPANSSPINKMFASISPPRNKSVKKIKDTATNNIGLSKIGDTNKFDKICKKIDLIEICETDPKPSEIQNSSIKTSKPSTSGHINKIFVRTPENFGLVNNNEDEASMHIQPFKNTPNGLLHNNSVVKTLDFDSNQKTINVKLENKNKILNLESESEYQIEDLAWARVGTYPFWPCLITRDPNGIFVKKKLFGRVEHYILHVTFFGDNGRRGWVVDNMLRKYLGIKEFLDTRDNFTSESKKKDRGFYNAFFVSEKKQAIWDTSVKEAETLLKQPKELRMDLLNQMIYDARLSKISVKVPNQPKPICKSIESPIDLSLSESLYDTLFSEDDSKDETEKTRKSRKNSLDVSEVVTACLDNMAAKTGLSQIQKQSHMDRWLQKAKSNTPEKCFIKAIKQITPNDVKKEVKAVSNQKSKRLRNSINSTEHSGSECMSENGISDAEGKTGNTTNHINGNEAEMLDRDVFISKKRMRKKVVKVNGYANDITKNCDDSFKPAFGTTSELNSKAPFKLSTEGNTIVIEPNIQNSKNVRSDYEPCESPTFTQNDFFDENEDKITIGNYVASKKINYHENDNDVGSESPTYTQNFMDFKTEVEINQVSGYDKQENMSIDGMMDEKQQTYFTDLERENIVSNTDFENMDISSNEYQTEDDKNLSKNFESAHNTQPEVYEHKDKQNTNSEDNEIIDFHNKSISSDTSASILIDKDLILDNEFVTKSVEYYINKIEGGESIANKVSGKASATECQVAIEPISLTEIGKKSSRNKQNQSKDDQVEFCGDVFTKNDHINIDDRLKRDSIDNKDTSLSDLHGENNSTASSKSIKQTIPESPKTFKLSLRKCKDLLNPEILNSSTNKDEKKPNKSKNKVQLWEIKSKDPIDINNPTFLTYFELKRDAVLDENPHLTDEDLLEYLFKTWLYEENLKTDVEKTDQVEQSNLVKGLDEERKPKRLKKKVLTLDAFMKIDITTNKEQTVELEQSNPVKELEESRQEKRKEREKGEENTDKLVQINLVKELNPDQKPKSIKKSSPRSETNTNSKNSTDENEDDEKSDELEQANLVTKSKELEIEEQRKRIKKKTERSIDETSSKNKICTSLENTDKLVQTKLVKELNTPITIKRNSPRSKTNTNSKNMPKINKKEEKSDELEQANLVTKDKELLEEQQRQIIKEEFRSPEINRSIDETSNDKHSTERNNSSNTEILVEIPLIKYENNCDSVSVDTNQILESPKSYEVGIIASADSIKQEIVDEGSPNNHKIKEKLPKKSKEKTDETKPVTKSGSTNMSNPEFLKYFELKKDALLDENPHVTEDDLLSYLYKTWLYEENLKTDIEKTDELEQANLVKGLNDDQQPKIIKKKVTRPEKNQEKVQKKIDVYFPKEKSKRNVAKAYYNEDDTDIEDEIAMFEIPIQESEETDDITKLQPIVNELAPSFSPHKVKSEENQISPHEVQELIPVDEQQFYLDQLLQPKPNIFKGLIREKVCLICEKAFNLIKCKGCHGMFHVDCVKNMTEAIQPEQSALKNKKKKRGRKPKFCDDNDETANSNSDENNVSFELKETNLIINLDEFESQFETKMVEILKQNIKEPLVFSPSTESCDWTKTVPGQCEIIDIKTKPKTIEMADFRCSNCQMYDTPVCFVCKLALSPKNNVEYRQRCQVPHCFSYYHLECLDMWPQTQFNAGQLTKCPKSSERFEAITCPRHVCHTCVCDDPRGCKTRFSSDKLAKCVRCPATYHSFTKCLPAGSKVLSASYIICPRHHEIRPGKVPCHVNTGWCFICALGGTLICCEYCPTSFHAECLNIKPPEGNYMCEDCETGRLPLYGEMVWVKLGHYRWWPGLVLHPCEIPENILAVPHSLGEFVVRFFGQYDYYWVNRGRVFPFHEGDSGRVSSSKSKIDEAFTVAITHAKKAFDMLKAAQLKSEEDNEIAASLLPPHYVKLKVNKPVGSVTSWRTDEEDCSLTQCECDPNDEDPCGMYSQCLNRMLLTECGPSCRAGDRCHNRAFEKRHYPRLAPYRTPHRGWGLKALQDIKQGEFVIEYVGELIDMAEFQRRMGRKHEMRDENYYFLTLDKDRMIDAGPKGNLARFMNHCCEPNCETQKWTVLGDVRVGLFAINDIPANSEVTFNYNLECAGIEKKQCMCGARRCSGYIGAKPKQDEQPPKTKRTYKKRKPTGTPSPTIKKKNPRAERSRTKERKPKELTEIEKDLLIIKMATSANSNDCDSLEAIDKDKGLKRSNDCKDSLEAKNKDKGSKKSNDCKDSLEAIDKDKGLKRSNDCKDGLEAKDKNKGPKKSNDCKNSLEAIDKDKESKTSNDCKDSLEAKDKDKGSKRRNDCKDSLEAKDKDKGLKRSNDCKDSLEAKDKDKGLIRSNDCKDSLEAKDKDKGLKKSSDCKDSLETIDKDEGSKRSNNCEDSLEAKDKDKGSKTSKDCKDSLDKDKDKGLKRSNDCKVSLENQDKDKGLKRNSDCRVSLEAIDKDKDLKRSNDCKVSVETKDKGLKRSSDCRVSLEAIDKEKGLKRSNDCKVSLQAIDKDKGLKRSNECRVSLEAIEIDKGLKRKLSEYSDCPLIPKVRKLDNNVND